MHLQSSRRRSLTRPPPAATAARRCRCHQAAAEYTCPRCNVRYCSLDCYRGHSERCTEGFYRCVRGGAARVQAVLTILPQQTPQEMRPPHPLVASCCRDAAVTELRSIRAGEGERQHMIDILQRMHQQEVEGGGGSGSSSGSEEEEAEEEGGGGLSERTLRRLLAKVGDEGLWRVVG